MSESKELLGAYLNDHLAGASAGVELAETILQDSEGTPLGSTMAAVLAEIQADRATLVDLMGRLGIARSTMKQAGAAAAEKVGRLRFHPRVTHSEDLTLLMEIEVLSVGIEGKRLLWQALKSIEGSEPELAATDLGRLIDRALRQRQDLEPFRVGMAGTAFGRS